MALWNARFQVRSVIKVKKKWSNIPCHNDIKRLKALIRRYGYSNGGKLNTRFLVTMVLARNDELELHVGTIKDSISQFDDEMTLVVCGDPSLAYRDYNRGKSGYSVVIELASRTVPTNSV